jgi:hypothetical protein
MCGKNKVALVPSINAAAHSKKAFRNDTSSNTFQVIIQDPLSFNQCNCFIFLSSLHFQSWYRALRLRIRRLPPWRELISDPTPVSPACSEIHIKVYQKCKPPSYSTLTCHPNRRASSQETYGHGPTSPRQSFEPSCPGDRTIHLGLNAAGRIEDDMILPYTWAH